MIPSHIYINEITRKLIKTRIIEDDTDTEFIYIDNHKMLVKSSPPSHPDTNIVGLKGLEIFEFYIKSGKFGFDNIPDYF